MVWWMYRLHRIPWWPKAIAVGGRMAVRGGGMVVPLWAPWPAEEGFLDLWVMPYDPAAGLPPWEAVRALRAFAAALARRRPRAVVWCPVAEGPVAALLARLLGRGLRPIVIAPPDVPPDPARFGRALFHPTPPPPPPPDVPAMPLDLPPAGWQALARLGCPNPIPPPEAVGELLQRLRLWDGRELTASGWALYRRLVGLPAGRDRPRGGAPLPIGGPRHRRTAANAEGILRAGWPGSAWWGVWTEPYLYEDGPRPDAAALGRLADGRPAVVLLEVSTGHVAGPEAAERVLRYAEAAAHTDPAAGVVVWIGPAWTVQALIHCTDRPPAAAVLAVPLEAAGREDVRWPPPIPGRVQAVGM